MKGALNERRMEWLLRARGTELATWPPADREAALDLMRRSPGVRQLYAEAVAREDDEPDGDGPDGDGAVFTRMQQALRRRLAPLPVALRGLSAGVLVACMAAGLYLAAIDLSGTETAADPFNTAQTVSLAALDQ